jgi:hypothetical protein
MRFPLFLLPLLAVAAVTAGAVPATAQGRNGICFYEHAHFQGRSFCIRDGQRVASVGPGFNDTFSSVAVPPGTRVQVCEHDHFAGQCITIDRSVANFAATGFNDRISSVAAAGRGGRGRDWDRGPDRGGDRGRGPDRHGGRGSNRDEVCFFEHDNFQGKPYCVRVGATVPSVGPADNDRFSSLTVPRGASVVACEHINFGGRCIRYTQSTRSLGGDWNDRISSFRTGR